MKKPTIAELRQSFPLNEYSDGDKAAWEYLATEPTIAEVQGTLGGLAGRFLIEQRQMTPESKQRAKDFIARLIDWLDSQGVK